MFLWDIGALSRFMSGLSAHAYQLFRPYLGGKHQLQVRMIWLCRVNKTRDVVGAKGSYLGHV